MKIQYVIIGAVLLAVIVGACGFFGGMTYAQAQARQQLTNFQQQRAAQGAGGAPGALPQGGQFGGGFRGQGNAQLGAPVANGQIKSINGNTVEISTADSVVTVTVNDETMITKTERGTVSDLQTGDRVTVFSKETGDSPLASGIQVQGIVPAAQPAQ